MRRALAVILATGTIASAFLFGNVGQAFANHIGCGDTITQDTTLDSDLIDCAGYGIVIGADNITLDLNGHTVDGDGHNFGFGVTNAILPDLADGHDGVTIENGVVKDFTFGVDLYASQRSVVRRLIAFSPVVVEVESSGNRITHNSFFSSGVGISGVDSANNRVANNSLVDSYISFDEEHAGGNVVAHNSLSGGGIGIGSSDNQRVVDNSISGAFEGISLGSANGNVVQRNTIEDSQQGISLSNSGGNVIRGNVVSGSLDAGIFMSGSPHANNNANQLVRNSAFGNAGDGMFLGDGNVENVIARNAATENGDDGIDVESPVTTIARNRANNNVDLGIEAVEGVIDGGGNRAFGNGNPLQCLNVGCK